MRSLHARIALLIVLALAGLFAVAQASIAARPAAGPNLDWPQYLHGPQHSSLSLTTAITPSNAASANQVWHWQPPAISGKPEPALIASPTVVAGRVYIGALSGQFYALDETSGAVAWHRQLDTEPDDTCGARGITATAAARPDPVTGSATVYVSGARYLYALNAATGAQMWKTRIGPASTATPNAYYNWSSPTVVGGHIYVGLASECDKPLIRGGVVELDQHTGAVEHTWHTVPAGSLGGSVWSSVAAPRNGSDIWVSTGNECDPTINTCPPGNQIGHSLSIVHLSSSLKLLQAWQVKRAAGAGRDWDFGSSPALFGTTGTPPDVGACNKNGRFYALAANPLSRAPVWSAKLGAAAGSSGRCLASAVSSRAAGALYVAGPRTTIGGTAYGGSVRQLDPATGAFSWETGLPCAVLGTPSLDSSGVLAVGTYRCIAPNTPGAFLIDASTGAILATLPVNNSMVFAQPVFAQNDLFVATATSGLYAFAPTG